MTVCGVKFFHYITATLLDLRVKNNNWAPLSHAARMELFRDRLPRAATDLRPGRLTGRRALRGGPFGTPEGDGGQQGHDFIPINARGSSVWHVLCTVGLELALQSSTHLSMAFTWGFSDLTCLYMIMKAIR